MASKRIQGITIEIGGDTTKLTKALQNVEKQINSSKNSLRDIDKLLKMDPKNVELLTQKQKALTDAIEGTKDKLKQEKEALEQLKNGPQTEQTIKQQEALTREIADTEQQLKSLEKEYKDFGSVAQQQTKAAAEEMQAAGKKIEAAGQTMTSIGRGMTTYVTAPIVAAGTAAVKTAADFDAAMSKVQAISGANAEEMEALIAKAREMGSQTKFSAEESAEALSYMAMAGWKTQDMLDGLPAIMHLAAASGEELGDTSDIVTDALTAFGLQAKDSAHFADVLAAAATNSNTNVSMLGQSFKYAAAPAGTLGYTAEDVALALGLMANNGIKADMAGTSLRNLFTRMAKPTKESQAAIDQLGLSLYDAQGNMYSFREVMYQIRDGFQNVGMSAEEFDAQVAQLDADLEAGNITQKKYDAALEDLTHQAFGAEEAEKARAAAMLGGARAMSGLLAIAQASDEDFNQLANAIDTSSNSFAKLADGSVVPLEEALASGAEIIEQYNGQAEAMAAIMEDNLQGDITKLKSDLQELAIAFGELLIPEVREFVQGIKEFVDKINAMDDGSKKTIITIGKIVAVIGPLLMILGAIVTAIGKVVWAIGTIKGALAAGGALAGFGAKLSAMWAGISGAATTAAGAVMGALEGIAAAVGATVGALLGAFALVAAAVVIWVKNWDEIKEAFRLFCEETAENFTAWKNDWIEAIEILKSYMSTAWESISQTISNVWEGIKIGTAAAWEMLTAGIREKIEIIKGIATGGFDYIKETISNRVNGIKDDIQQTFENIKKFIEGFILGARTWGEHLIDNITAGIRSKFDGLRNAVSNAGDIIKSYLHFSEPDVGPLSDFNSWMPDMMKQMAQQINAGIPMVESAMQGTAGAIRGGFDYTDQLSSINRGIGNLALAGGGDINVTLEMDKMQFGKAVVRANQSTNYRNGGR